MKQLKKIARNQKQHTYALMFVSFLMGVVIVIQAYLIVSIVDLVFLQGASFPAIVPLLGLLLVAFLARVSFTYINGRIGIQMGTKAKRDFRNALLQHYGKHPIQASLQGQSGQRVSTMIDCVDEIDPYFSKYYPQLIQASGVPIIILLAVFWQNWLSALILLITAPLIPILMIVIGRASKKKAEQQMEKLALFSGKFLDILQGLVTLKFFGKAKQQRDAIYKSSINYREATMDVLKVAFVSSLMLEFISMLGIALIALELGLRIVIYEQLTFYTAFFVLLLAPEFYATLKELGSAFHAGRGSMGAANKIMEELAEIVQPVVWGNDDLNVDKIPPRIRLKDVTFQYTDHSFSISGINVTIEPFSEVAIVGRSGAGKTTLLHLIAGLYDTAAGNILVNDVPLFDYKEQEWFNQLIYISQNPYLFSGTIKDNIMMGSRKEEVSREELEVAVMKAGLIELIASLEDGDETTIGEGGRGLSGGEKQRIALARAFLKKPTVILFDEPTVGLDLRTEQVLQHSIKELSQTATVITVAHRLHTIKKADQILFLENGKLVVTDTHQELLNSSVEYRNMFEAQSRRGAG